MNAIWSGAIQGMLVSNICWKDLPDALRGMIEAKHFKKHPFQTDAVAFSWLNKARFRRRSTHVPDLTEVLSTAKERRLNQFGTSLWLYQGHPTRI